MMIDQEAEEALAESPGNPFNVSQTAKPTENPREPYRTTRSKHSKRIKAPTRLERARRLQDQVTNLVEELQREGFAAFLPPPGPVDLISPEIEDPKTQGRIGHAQELLGTYIRRVSIRDNFFQRPPFDHVTDPIYRRLIRDFIEGAAMPETKIAALSTGGGQVSSLGEEGIKFSIIDGLQRLYCFLIAILLVWKQDQLVKDWTIPSEGWEFFAESVNKSGDPHCATEKLLQRLIRFEIFYGINLSGLLHYMVTFNSGQRRMNLRMQLEIMKSPLIEHLKREGIPVWEDMEKMPGERRPKDSFSASELVLATQAFITNNAHVTTSFEAERFLDENQPYLDNVGDISDVMKTLKRIATEIHPTLLQIYGEDTSKRHLISDGETFLLGFIAACGYIRNRTNMMVLDRALDKLVEHLHRSAEDPVNLESYQRALTVINHLRGKAARRLVDDTFRRFFLGVTTELEWLDTARQITGCVA